MIIQYKRKVEFNYRTRPFILKTASMIYLNIFASARITTKDYALKNESFSH